MARQNPKDIPYRGASEPFACLNRKPRDVRRDNHVFKLKKFLLNLRFGLQHVQPCSAQSIGSESSDQRLRIHESTPANVDQNRLSCHQINLSVRDEMMSLWRIGKME